MSDHRSFHYGNHFLDTLNESDSGELWFQLNIVTLHEGQIINSHKGEFWDVYFPTSAEIALETTLRDGDRKTFAVISNEGVTPLRGFRDDGDLAVQTSLFVVKSGFAYRLRALSVRRWARTSVHRGNLLGTYRIALESQFMDLLAIAYSGLTNACHRAPEPRSTTSAHRLM
jgi:hypothetical protein